MIRFCAITFLLATFLVGHAALSRTSAPVDVPITITPGNAGGTCPLGNGTANDGCNAANDPALGLGAQAASTIQDTTVFNGYASQAGCSVTANGGTHCRPPWNVAGVDYPVGPDAASYPAVLSGNLPACATMSGALVTINSAPCEIKHLSFNGVCLALSTGVSSGTITIDNNIFTLAAGCDPNGGSILFDGPAGSSSGTQKVHFMFNMVDGTYSRTDTSCGGGSCINSINGFTCGASDSPGSGAGVVIEYNYIYNIYGNVWFLNFPNSCTAEQNYNFIKWVGGSGTHADNPLENGSSNSVATINSTFNTSTQTSSAAIGGTGLWTFGETVNAGLQGGTIKNNVGIANCGAGCSTNFGTIITCCTVGFSPGGEVVDNNYMDETNSNHFIQTGTVTSTTCHGNVDLTTGAIITSNVGGLTCN